MTTLTELSKRDRMRQQSIPTLMVPKDSLLPACQVGQTRFLMASDGMYLESVWHWGSFVKKLWHSERDFPLPYGDVEERNDLLPLLSDYLFPIISTEILPQAAAQAEIKNEWAGLIVWNGNSLEVWPVAFDTGPVHARCIDGGLTDLPTGYSIVCDIHSHHVMKPCFSEEDNITDKGRCKVAIVIGNYRKSNEGKGIFDCIGRYCVEGYFFNDVQHLLKTNMSVPGDRGGGL